MRTLGEEFERIYVISLPWADKRRNQLLRQLNEQGVYEPKVRVITAVHGDTIGVPAWWKSGGGAWGCLRSHSRVLEEAAMDKLENFLVLEDDAQLGFHFEEQFDTLMTHVPDNWEQLYLGGQNLLEPVKINDHVIEPKDMNRTHAYAVHQKAYRKIHAHINYAPDYMSAYPENWFPHVDHQLGRAHRRGDWRTYAPKVNLVGQKENASDINGRWHPDKWWDWPEGDCYRFLPYVIIENDGSFAEVRGLHNRGRNRRGERAKHLHFGWKVGANKLTFREAWDDPENPAKLYNAFSIIAAEAFECRRLPAFYGNEKQVAFLRSGWPGGTTSLGAIRDSGYDILDRLEQMCDYPWNGILKVREAA